MRLVLCLLLLFVTLSCSKLPISGIDPALGNFPFISDFETALSTQIHNETANAASMVLAAAPLTITGGSPGSKSLQLVVNPADAVNHGNRSELAVYHCGNVGETMYFGWDLAIPQNDPDDYQWQITAQWYQLPDFERGETFDFWGAHPPVTLVLVPGKIQLKTTVGGEALLGEALFAKGVWHRLVVGITFMNTDDGAVMAWLDGVAMTSAPVKTKTLWNRAGAYFKCGLYRGGVGQGQAPSSNYVFIDNLRIARTKAEVQ